MTTNCSVYDYCKHPKSCNTTFLSNEQIKYLNNLCNVSKPPKNQPTFPLNNKHRSDNEILQNMIKT